MATPTTSRARTERKDTLERLKRSQWVLLTLVPLGLTAWGAFVYAGVRARRRLWVGFGILYLALIGVAFALTQLNEDDDHWTSDAGGGLTIFVWAAAVVHALVIRSDYLERMDVIESPQLDAGEDRLLRRKVALEIAREDPERALDLGIGRPDRDGSFHGELVDVNHASAEVIARLPGVDDDLARRTVEVREEINGFSSLADYGHVLGLPAPVVERLRDEVVFLPR